ncbi:MAG TPA: hypothetical protein VN660_01000 [Steroidobacteraceae bacterium]|nr:hypothetical protein [Steroidobacteraceae bacterium]
MVDKKTAENARIGAGKPGPGRPKGMQNKVTRDVREALSQFVEGNASRVQALWENVAGEDPGKALDLYAKLAEFVQPKLARTELSGEVGVRGRLVITD